MEERKKTAISSQLVQRKDKKSTPKDRQVKTTSSDCRLRIDVVLYRWLFVASGQVGEAQTVVRNEFIVSLEASGTGYKRVWKD